MANRVLKLVAIIALLAGLLVPSASTPVSAAPTPCADLVVVGFTTDPVVPVQDLTTAISITIQNQGSCAAPGFVVQWKSDRFAQTGPSTPVTGLGPRATTTVTFNFDFPRPGNFLTVVNLDTADTVSETNENNNLEILSVTVERAFVDLVVSSISFTPARPVQGRVAQASVTVTNQGNSPAGSFIVEWKPTPFAAALTQQVNSLGIGASTTLTFNFTYQLPGTFNSTATVDSTRRVAESNEFNNSLTVEVIVEPPLPDLVVTGISFNPSPPVRGSVTTATITVQNIGNSPAGDFLVEWKPSPLAQAQTAQVNSLATGASTTVSFGFTYAAAGTFNSTATADSTNRERELDEENNSLTVQVVVSPSTVDLYVSSLSITPSSPTQGAPATVRIGVTNGGDSPAGSFLVQWNADALGLGTGGPSSVSRQVEGLGAGQTTTVEFVFVYGKAGNFRSIAEVDSFDNVVETNEANNLDILNITVQPAPIDLVIDSFTINPASPVRATDVTATIVVRNAGPFAANNFAVQWRLNQENNFGPTEGVNGLNPGESRTITLEGTYFTAGTFTSVAIVDVFDTVLEPGAGESNNTRALSVTVQPRQTTVRVTFNQVNVFNSFSDGINGEGEWQLLYAVLDRDASCNATISPGVIDDVVIDQDGIECRRKDQDNIGGDDGEILVFNPNVSFEVTLLESTPLLVAVAGFQDGSIIEPPDFTGFAFELVANNKLTNGNRTLQAQQGQCGGEGRCYDVRYLLEVLSAPPALAADTAALALPEGSDAIPDGLKQLMPARMIMPEATYKQYLPGTARAR